MAGSLAKELATTNLSPSEIIANGGNVAQAIRDYVGQLTERAEARRQAAVTDLQEGSGLATALLLSNLDQKYYLVLTASLANIRSLSGSLAPLDNEVSSPSKVLLHSPELTSTESQPQMHAVVNQLIQRAEFWFPSPDGTGTVLKVIKSLAILLTPKDNSPLDRSNAKVRGRTFAAINGLLGRWKMTIDYTPHPHLTPEEVSQFAEFIPKYAPGSPRTAYTLRADKIPEKDFEYYQPKRIKKRGAGLNSL